VDMVPDDGSDPIANVELIRNELAVFSAELGSKPELLVLNKVDLIPEAERAKKVMKMCNALRVPAARRVVVSGATGEGLREMLEACWKLAEHDVAAPWRAIS